MAGSQRLEIKQGQSLVMTPQLQQSLKLLQLSSNDLIDYIDEQLEKNPLLLREDQQDEPADEKRLKDGNSDDSSGISKDLVATGQENAIKDPDMDMSFENSWDNTENSGDLNNKSDGDEASFHYSDVKNINSSFDNDDFGYEQNLSEAKTLREHIAEQVQLDIHSAANRMIAAHLIDILDDSGYISVDLKQIAEQLGCKAKDVENVLLRLQKCDPPGIFARNLAECLKLQLIDKNHYDPAMEKLLQHLNLVAEGKFEKLQKICGVDKEDIKDMCLEIRALNPKPGADFEEEMVETMYADVFVRRGENGKGWQVEVNSERLPKLLVNKKYYAEVKEKTRDEVEKKYLTEQMNNASWLVKTLNQRAETILKVATELVAQQGDFFEKGIAHLKPLILKDIAEKIDVHESTVGRVTSNKYISTPRGMFEMKYFFTSSLANSESGGEISSTTVKHLIKGLVEKEDVKTVLSDDKIADILQDKGVDVARRTVAKYREAMNIPSSVERRKAKRRQASGSF